MRRGRKLPSNEERERLRVAWDASFRVCLDQLRERDGDAMSRFRDRWQEIYDEKGVVTQDQEFDLWLREWVNTSPPPRLSERRMRMEAAREDARLRAELRDATRGLRDSIEELSLTNMELAEKIRDAFADVLNDEEGET